MWRRGEPEIFEEIKYRDQLVHHPFDSFSTVEAFVDAAVDDPHVVAIKMTLYRIGANSPLVDRLITAARPRQAGGGAGRAEGAIRRAEQHRVGDAARGGRRARRLRRAGSEDALQDLPGRAAGGGRRSGATCTSPPATTTARRRTSIPTSACSPRNPRIVADVSELFNYLTGYSNQTDYRELLVAPVALRRRFAQAGRARDRRMPGTAGRRASSSRSTR